MCGIAGYIGKREIGGDHIETCLGLMGRRGPDHRAARHWTGPSGHAYLLHSRLSIIDLDPRARQPMHLNGSWIALNGELYNYLEVRARLADRGCTFQTASDTEVLLTALSEHGIAALDACEGMWAFALYDEREGSLLLCRDRFGEKPLYLFRDDSGLYFGSEVKFIQALVGKPLRPNRTQLLRYIVNGYKSLHKQRETFFEGVEELPSGSTLRISGNGERCASRYWAPPVGPREDMTYDDAVRETRERLLRAVELRLRADVPLAFCMSGGIDSNSLLSIAKRVFGYEVHGFTLYMNDARYDERKDVENVVRQLGIRHTPVPVTTENFRHNMQTLVRQHDAPLYTISYYIHWLLMGRIADHGYRISISGTAADELFTGYYDHHNLYLHEVRGSPEYDRSLEGWKQHVAPFVRNPHLQNPELYDDDASFREHIYLNHAEFSSYSIDLWSEPFFESAYSPSLLRNRMLNELFHEAVPVILHEDDLNAMYFSIENRSPFLDRDLFEHAFSIPTRFLVRDGFAKVVLRDAMAGIVPEEILWNPRKVGFNAPLESFVDFRDPETRAWLLADGPVFDIMRKDRLTTMIDKPAQLLNSESKFLFNVINAKVFLEQFN